MFTNEYFSNQVPAHTEGEGCQPNVDSSRQEEGGSKITKNVQTSFMDGSKYYFISENVVELNESIVEILCRSDSYGGELYILLFSFSLICKADALKVIKFFFNQLRVRYGNEQ